MSNQPTVLIFEGVGYVCHHIGGRGWTIGCGSVVEAIDGPNKGKFYKANIWGGIHRMPVEISKGEADFLFIAFLSKNEGGSFFVLTI